MPKIPSCVRTRSCDERRHHADDGHTRDLGSIVADNPAGPITVTVTVTERWQDRRPRRVELSFGIDDLTIHVRLSDTATTQLAQILAERDAGESRKAITNA